MILPFPLKAKRPAAALVSALALSVPALAADMRGFLPAAPAAGPRHISDESGLYLRGDLAYGINRASDIVFTPPSQGGEKTLSHTMRSTGAVSVGIGYQVNPLLRGDITLEQRSSSRFRYLDRVENVVTPANYFLNDVRGKMGLRLAMANAYVNLGRWERFTPYLGLGFGAAATSIRDVTDKGVGPGNNAPTARGIGTNTDAHAMAFALHAGLSYDLGANWSVDAGYRYLALGTVRGGAMNCYNAGTGTYDNCGYRTVIKSLGVHDLRFGLRYLFGNPAPAPVMPQPGYMGAPPPVVAKG